jgi:short subunit dehydrogenase-like uncharacterized protein
MSGTESWMLYGAAGHTGALIAQHASESGHRPLLAGRSAPTITALAGRLGLPAPAAVPSPAQSWRSTPPGRRPSLGKRDLLRH